MGTTHQDLRRVTCRPVTTKESELELAYSVSETRDIRSGLFSGSKAGRIRKRMSRNFFSSCRKEESLTSTHSQNYDHLLRDALSWVAPLVLLICILGIRLPPLAAQACTEVQPVQGANGYQARSGPDRCEGLYRSPVAGESIALLALQNGDIAFDLQNDRTLVVSVPDVSRFSTSKVAVHVRALPLGLYYRMDATVESGGSIDWPITAVIVPVKIHPDSLGVVGTIESGGNRVFVPVTIFAKGKPSPPHRSATAVFRSTVDVEQVRWRIYSPTSSSVPKYETASSHVPVRAGDPIRLSVPLTASPVNLEIAVKKTNSDDWMKLLLPVLVP